MAARRPRKKMGLFLAAYRKHGGLAVACREAKIARSTVYNWRDQFPEFATEMDDALAEGLAGAEARLLQIANAGDGATLRWLLSRRMPEEYGDKSKAPAAPPEPPLPDHIPVTRNP